MPAKLSTHVLDTAHGCPASGMKIELWSLDGEERELVTTVKTNADGRPDQLIRGADIVGTPLASFAKIIATSDKTEVFNGYCGAESGSVPVSAVSPAVLISEIEIQKKDSGQDLLPLLPSPLKGSIQ